MKTIAFARHMLVLSLFAVSTLAFAHEPALHQSAAKMKPTTCEQYADPTHYSNDLSDPDIKALKDKCDAEATSAKADAEPK
jgi:hypothetical protein